MEGQRRKCVQHAQVARRVLGHISFFYFLHFNSRCPPLPPVCSLVSLLRQALLVELVVLKLRARIELRDLPASASHVLRLRARTTVPRYFSETWLPVAEADLKLTIVQSGFEHS